MISEEKIQQAYAESKSYPELAARLSSMGVNSYTVDVVTGITLFRSGEGTQVLQRQHLASRVVAPGFNQALTIQAIRENQQGKTDYAQFMEGIAAAGVRFYEATLIGRKRVTYIGVEGEYEEEIPA